ncbi:MAG: phosphoglycerate kinase, partial [Alphaproteobacteria bacterium]|nr:phosphoglycerate kinase [Alphaproteobacteria bacterium]
VVGGCDIVSVLNACDVMQYISYVSTGGGAFLEFIQGDVLPGIDALIKNNIKSDL